METEVDVKQSITIKTRTTEFDAGSARQNAALTRWAAAQPATVEQIAAITGCDEDLAKRIAKSRHAPRRDAKTRHGKPALLFPYFSQALVRMI